MHILEKVESYQKEQVKKIMEMGKTAKKGGIVLFGDSHMQYFDEKMYFPDKNIYNCGLEGATSDLLFHLRPIAVEPFDPRKVVVCIGVNDLNDYWKVDKLEIAFNVYRLIEILRRYSPAIDICVISPLPIAKNLCTSLCDNVQLKILGKEIGNNVNEFSGCVYLDVFEDFMKDGYINPIYTKDGIHLNEEGYALLAGKLQSFIYE